MRVHPRFEEHENVIDLQWHRLLRQFQSLMLDTSATLQPGFSHFDVYGPITGSPMFAGYRPSDRDAETALREMWNEYSIKPVRMVWVDEESFWDDRLHHPEYLDPYTIPRRTLDDDE